MTPGNWVVICVLAILAAFLAYGFSFDFRHWLHERRRRRALVALRAQYERTVDAVGELEAIWSLPERTPKHERTS